MRKALFALFVISLQNITVGGEADSSSPLIGYTQFQTNLPGGRHANVRTMRAMIARKDGSNATSISAELAGEPDSWTQFGGWSPDGQQAIINRGWQAPDNAKWEEEHKSFRMLPGKWQLDSYIVELSSKSTVNLTAVERVSHYNGGLFFLPNGMKLGFTPLIGGISKPYLMDLDGRNKKDVSGDAKGFSYGYSSSPDGKWISYHENYQVYIARPDGSEKRHIKTGNTFDFAPRWSPDSQWLLFVSGEHYKSNPYVVKSDGSELKKLVDLNGYPGFIEFLDVFDFHQGSSDLPVWSIEGNSVFYTAKVDKNVELFQSTLDGEVIQLTKSPPGTLHYHPLPSPDGRFLLYGVKRQGVRHLVNRNLKTQVEQQLTTHSAGVGAMWPYWQPVRSRHSSSE